MIPYLNMKRKSFSNQWHKNRKSLKRKIEIYLRVAEILKNAGMDPGFREAFANAFAFAFNDVLLRKDTTEKLRMFLQFLIETEKSQE